MKVTAIAPWFGSKRTLSPYLNEEFGAHQAYWSLFGGSLADILGKPPCSMETATDLHGDVINLARVLANYETAVELYSRLRMVLMHEQLIVEAQERVVSRAFPPAPETPDVERAVDYMHISWCGRNGVAGTKGHNLSFCVRYTKNGGAPAKRWHSAIESIPDWHDRLRNVMILNDDAFSVVEKIEDAAGTVIYADPPYLVKGSKYLHDFSEWIEGDEKNDHVRLAKALNRFQKTRVVVSYYDHPALAVLYPDWRKRAIDVPKGLSNAAMRKSGEALKAPEVLLINDRRSGKHLF